MASHQQAESKNTINPASAWGLDGRGWIKVLVVLGLGVAVALAVYQTAQDHARKKFRAGFEDQAGNLALAIKRELAAGGALLELMAKNLGRDSAAIERRFTRLGRALLERQKSLKTLALLSYTPAPKPKPGRFTVRRFVNRPGSGQGPGLLGRDLGELPAARHALARAQSTGKLASSGQLYLPGAEGLGREVLFFYPTGAGAKPAASGGALGFAGGMLMAVQSLPETVRAALHALRPAGLDLLIRDLSESPGKRTAHLEPSRLDPGRVPSKGLETAADGGLKWESQVEVGGHVWQVVVTPAPSYLATRPLWLGRALLAGLLSAAFLAAALAYVFLAASRQARLRKGLYAQRLQNLSARIQDILGIIPAPVLLTGPGGQIIQANPEFSELSGYSPEELGGMSGAMLFGEEEGWHDHQGGPGQKARAQWDGYLRRKDGHRMPVRKASTPFEDRAGKLVGEVQIVQDIEWRRRVMDQLAQSESRFEEILSSASEGFWSVEPGSMTILDTNQALCELLGYQRGEILGRSVYDFIAPEGLESYRHHTSGIGGPGRRYYNAVFITRDGHRVEASLSGITLFDDNERPREAVAFISDITAIRQAQRAALREEAKLAAIISSMEDGVLFVCRRGTVKEINGAMCRFLRLERDKVLGTPLALLGGGEAGRIIRAELERFHLDPLKPPKVSQRPLGGAEVTLQIQPVFINKAYDGVMLQLSDVTGLVRARQQAERASRAKSGFLAKMSHEIKTPLNGVIGLTNLVLDSELSAEQRENLELVKDSAHTLLGVINRILDFSQLESGDLSFEPQRFDPRLLLDRIMDKLRPAAEAKGLSLHAAVSNELPHRMIGDSVRLEQVLVGLLENAVKFTEQGAVKLEAKVLEQDYRRVLVGINVKDTGIGIMPGKLKDIFRAFVQEDSSTTRRHGGTGLGLAICASLVRLMEGDIWAESRPGGGSEFHLSLPFVLEAGGDAGMPVPPADKAGGGSLHRLDQGDGGGHGLNILVAEDNPVNQKLLVKLLERWGHRVATADNGREAVNATSREPYDLVLMDLQMPVMDGLEAVAAIREREKEAGSRVPVVALTAHCMQEGKERCLQAGMDGFLAKPVSGDELAGAIGRATGWQPPKPSPAARGRAGLASVARRFEGDLDLARQVVQTFLHEEPGLSAVVFNAFDDGGGKALAAAAHTLKGSLAYFPASRALELCRLLEQKGGDIEPAKAGVILKELRSSLDLLRNELELMLNEEPH